MLVGDEGFKSVMGSRCGSLISWHAPLEEPQDEHDHTHDDQEVDQKSSDLENHQPEHPRNYQDNANGY
jgi:hypothetical protein